MKGLHPNTRDDGVVDYLNKFGKVLTTKVVYPVYGEGPLKGFKNGDQQYKVELKPNSILGTYHVLDRQRVCVRYSGQRQTCARCFGSGKTCPGRGTARKCEQEGGQRKDFTEYFRELWLHLGYSPSDVKLDSELEEQYCITVLLKWLVGSLLQKNSSSRINPSSVESVLNLSLKMRTMVLLLNSY